MILTPGLDMLFLEILLVVSFLASILTWVLSKKWFLALIVFSILGNLSFLVNIASFVFVAYNIIWLQYFSLFIWPLINIFLIIRYRKQKREKV